MGNAYLAGNAAEGRRVLLVNAAVGSTGLCLGEAPPWAAVAVAARAGDPHGRLYRAAITETRAAAAALSRAHAGELNRVAGIFWIQGEEDGIEGVPGGVYAAALRALIAGLRNALAPLQPPAERARPIPFIIGSMVPDFMALPENAGLRVIDAAHREVAASDAAAAFCEGPAGNTCLPGIKKGRPLIHYTPPNAHALGALMARALLRMQREEAGQWG